MRDFQLREETKEELVELSNAIYEFCEDHNLPLIMRVVVARRKEGTEEKSCFNFFEAKNEYGAKEFSKINRLMYLLHYDKDFLKMILTFMELIR